LKNQSANADVFQGAGLMKLDKKKRIGVLYSDCIISAACTESIEKAVRIIASQKYIDTELVEINADFPSSLKVLDNNGRNIDVLVNALGPYYPEGKLPEILQYYRNGGTILNIGIKPFSVPYEVIDGTVCFHGEFNGAIRSFEVLDEYVPTGAMGNNMNFGLMDPRYGFLKSLYDSGEFPYMKETYGNIITWHITKRKIQNGQMRSGLLKDAWIPSAGGRMVREGFCQYPSPELSISDTVPWFL